MALLPVPAMTDTPHFPALSERAAGTYNSSAYAFGVHMADTFNAELDAVAGNVLHNAGEAASSAQASADSAQLAQDATNATLIATAYKGPWASLSGALATPASVWHQGQYWTLLSTLADVQATEPGTNLAVWVPLVAGAAPSVQITTNTTAQPGLRYLLCAPGITLTLPATLAKGDYFGFVDLVGDGSCSVDFNGHKFRGRATGVVSFDIPFSGGSATYEDSSKGLV